MHTRKLENEFAAKTTEFDYVIKMEKPHLQDTVLIRLERKFDVYARVIKRDRERMAKAARELLTVNIGATAVETGLNAILDYMERVTSLLSGQIGVQIQLAENLVDSTQNTDAFPSLSVTLKVFTVNLSKICNNIRLVASEPKAGGTKFTTQTAGFIDHARKNQSGYSRGDQSSCLSSDGK